MTTARVCVCLLCCNIKEFQLLEYQQLWMCVCVYGLWEVQPSVKI